MLNCMIWLLRVGLIVLTLLCCAYSVWTAGCIVDAIHCNERWPMPRGVLQFLFLLMVCVVLLSFTLFVFGCNWSLIFKVISIFAFDAWLTFYIAGCYWMAFNSYAMVIGAIVLVLMEGLKFVAFEWSTLA